MYNPGGPNSHFQGSPADQSAFAAREEVADVLVGDDETHFMDGIHPGMPNTLYGMSDAPPNGHLFHVAQYENQGAVINHSDIDDLAYYQTHNGGGGGMNAHELQLHPHDYHGGSGVVLPEQHNLPMSDYQNDPQYLQDLLELQNAQQQQALSDHYNVYGTGMVPENYQGGNPCPYDNLNLPQSDPYSSLYGRGGNNYEEVWNHEKQENDVQIPHVEDAYPQMEMLSSPSPFIRHSARIISPEVHLKDEQQQQNFQDPIALEPSTCEESGDFALVPTALVPTSSSSQSQSPPSDHIGDDSRSSSMSHDSLAHGE